MNRTKNLLSPFRIFLILLAAAALTFYGCGNDDQNEDEVMDEMYNMDGDHMDEEMMDGEDMPMLGEEVVREGVIDVESIDENGDGYVYQDPMDWNVISDMEGNCPVCGMEMKKVTIAEAKKNLKEHDYEYKQ